MTDAAKPAGWRRGMPWLLGFLIVVFAFVLWIGSNPRSTDADIEAMRRGGFPTTYDDLDRQAPAKGENAAPLYDIVVARISGGDEAKACSLLTAALDDTSSTAPVSPTVLSKLSGVLALCRKGAQMPRCVFPRQTRDGKRDSFKFPLETFRIAEILSAAAKVESENGQPNLAAQDLEAANNVACQMAAEPGFATATIAALDEAAVLINWPAIVETNRKNRSLLQTALRIVDSKRAKLSLKQVCAGELPTTLLEYRGAIKHPEKFIVWKPGMLPSKPSPLLANSVVMTYAVRQAVHEWRDVLQAMPKDPDDNAGSLKALQNGDRKFVRLWPARALFVSPFGIYARTNEEFDRTLVQERLAKMSASILLYRLDYGSLPLALPETDEDTIDPYNGKPLRYRKDGTGFVVWSVGKDGINNGGAARTIGFNQDADVAIRFN